MMQADSMMDAVVIGGGFYGSAIAIYLAQQRGLDRVILLEKEEKLLSRASYHNQARVHNGYHYPRSFTTAFRSRINFPRFVHDWTPAINKDFINLYAVARKNSKVMARQFEVFCQKIGSTIYRADESLNKLFNPQLIEEVFVTEEYTFDAVRLAKCVEERLSASGVKTYLLSQAIAISHTDSNGLSVTVTDASGDTATIRSRYVFNCTYSRLNQLGGEFPGCQTSLKHEITEMALVKVPTPLENMGITVMDGPFFSMMPFPARNLHTLSHVRYTPHHNWNDQPGIAADLRLDEYERTTRAELMIRDVARYLPAISSAKHVDSLFEVKTILVKNEDDDGRPILFEKHQTIPGCYSVLGGKIDNIYDVLEKLDNEEFEKAI